MLLRFISAEKNLGLGTLLTKCSADGRCVNLVRKYFCNNYFAFTIHMGSNCYINTGVRDLEVALFKANST